MKKIIATLIMFVILTLAFNTVFASEKMTVSDLDKAIKKFNESEYFLTNYKLNGNYIDMYNQFGDKVVSVLYDLDNKPTFVTEVTVRKDFSENEYSMTWEQLYIGALMGIAFVETHVDIGVINILINLEDNLPEEMKSFIINSSDNIYDEFYKRIGDDGLLKNNDYSKIKYEIINKSESEFKVKCTTEVDLEKLINDKKEVDEYYNELSNIIHSNTLENNINNIIDDNKYENTIFSNEISMDNTTDVLKPIISGDKNNDDNKTNTVNKITKIPQTGKGFEITDLLWIVLGVSVVSFGGYVVYNRRKDGNV